VVTDGASASPLSDSYVVNAPKADVSASLVASHLAPDKVTHAYTPIVVNTGSKLIVMDTGTGVGSYTQSKGALGQFHTNLAAAGIDKNAVDIVLISHMHGDHINGLLGADNKLAFPNAEVLVPAVDWKFWLDESNEAKFQPPIKPQFANARRVFDALGRKATQYESGKEVAPGITAIATPGHTPGHNSFVIASGSDKVLVQIDITAGAASLFALHPDWQFVFDSDKPLAVQTRKKMYDMATADKMLVQGFHFPFPGIGYMEKAGGGYRFVPAPWNPVI